MITFERLSLLDKEREQLLAWCRKQQPTMSRSASNYVVGSRQEKWLEMGWKLSKEISVFEAEHNEEIYRLGQRLFPGNHACLFLYYPPRSYIKTHRDHTVSENLVVQINLGCAVTLTVENQDYFVADGEVVAFNSKLLHSVSAANSDRFVISWRKIKPQYLQKQLSLF